MLPSSYSWLEISLLIFAGILAGIINTMAGSGTIFTFGAMLFLGIPIVLANTTNRVGVCFQNIAAIGAYFKYGNYSLKKLNFQYLAPTFVGAVLGAILAVDVSERLLNGIAALVMILLLVQNTTRFNWRFPHRFDPTQRHSKWSIYSILFVVGLYGGFIQIGIGMLLLTSINYFSNQSLKDSNFIKLSIILIYSVPTTAYFIIQGKIIWIPAILLSIGQVIGGFLAGAFANLTPAADFWVKRLVIAMIVLTLIKILFL